MVYLICSTLGLFLKVFNSLCTTKKCDAIIKNETLSQVVWNISSLKLIPGCTLDSYLLMKNILNNSVPFNSVTQSCLTLHPHGLQHARPPYPSPTPGVYSNLCPLSQRWHSTISSSVVPFSPHLQSFPASGSILVSQLFTLGGQSIGVSASTLVLPMNIQD